MTETATSPRQHSHTRSSRPTTTPAARPPHTHPGSVGQTMPPLLSPRTPHQSTIPSVKTPSPNYFGFQTEDTSFLTDSPQHAKGNWSPPSSTVRSTAAASPSVVPLDQNPEYDAFRRQSEGGKAFNLGSMSGNFRMSMPAQRSDPPRRTSSKVEQVKEKDPATYRKNLDPAMAEVGRSPKRVLSPGSMILPEEVRRASPASFTHSDADNATKNATLDSQPRFALPLDKTSMTPMEANAKARAETLPAKEAADVPMVTAQHVVNLLESKVEQVLLLDLRVQTQYAKSHIAGALNLCIPTTLLKRPSFNVQKLADAFKDEAQRAKFEQWKSSSYIIVYDNSSAQLKDAAICLNTIKKFKGEGYEGTLYIVKGGFSEFSRRFSAYIETSSDSDSNDDSRTGVDSEGPLIAPVVGGCPMPSTDKPANPFFGNIRQNMDLIGGVGQIALKHPSKVSKSAEEDFPDWLRQVAEDEDQGKKAANKFENIERREKKRMEEALSGKVSYADRATPKKQTPTPTVQIAGIEKGSKNRYNNIWPFEHSRVKLQGLPRDICDYFNASYIKAARSSKRYISTQAPIPATFNDFWNVVWQQDVRVIVMLTAEKEGAQVKAHDYWSSKQYGPLHLDRLSEKRASIDLARIHRRRQQSTHSGGQNRPSMQSRASGPQIPHTQLSDSPTSNSNSSSEEPYVTVRRFTLSHDRFPFAPMREITQLQYSNWPDFGAPAHPAHLLGLVEQCDNVVRSVGKGSQSDAGGGRLGDSGSEPVAPEVRPVLVHCSAGCGRTGTFCTVDSVIDMLKRQRLSEEEKAKGRGAKKQGTPMEIDSTPPSKTPGGAKKAKEGTISSNDADGFFASTTSQSGPDDNVDGAWVQRDDLDLVERTVEDFRRQRISMVQSLRQYVLCYESVMEWLVEQHRNGGS